MDSKRLKIPKTEMLAPFTRPYRSYPGQMFQANQSDSLIRLIICLVPESSTGFSDLGTRLGATLIHRGVGSRAGQLHLVYIRSLLQIFAVDVAP